MDLIKKLQNIPMPVINLIMIASIAIPLVIPLGLPIKIDPMTRAAYNTIQNMPEGSVVIFDYGMTASYIIEMGPACNSMTAQMFEKDFKILFFSGDAQGPVFAENEISPIAEEFKKTYGVDWVILGFAPGGEVAITAILADIKNVFSEDFYGTPIDNLPLMEVVQNHEQIDLAIYTGGGGDRLPAWVRQANTAYGTTVIFIPAGGMIAYATPYYPNQAAGIVGSLRGSAEYELLTRRPGAAISGMDSLSLSFLYLMFLVILCNISVIISFIKGGKK